MKIKIILINTMIMIAFLSCSSGKYFTNYYTGNYTGLDTLINLQGYYISSSCDPFYYTMTMFYNNGLAVNSTMSDDDVSDFAINLYKGRLNNKYTQWLVWGSYVIKDDTIKLQTDIPNSFLYPSGTFIEYSDFKILPDGKIQLVSNYLLGDSWHYDWKMYPDCNKPSVFFPIETKADSTKCPLLKKKWFWNNEVNKKAYMEKIKQKK